MDVKQLAARLARELDLSVTDAGTYFVRPDQLETLVRRAMVEALNKSLDDVACATSLSFCYRLIHERIKELSK